MPCDGEYVQRTQTKSDEPKSGWRMEDRGWRSSQQAILHPPFSILHSPLLWLGILLAGCAASPHPRAGFEGASAPAPFSTEDWTFHNAKGKVLTSAHYKIF